MNIRIILLVIFVFSASLNSSGQDAYWVFFANKKDCTFNPYEYFDAKAIERRQLHQLPLFDSTDFPVNKNYLLQVESLSDSTIGTSRWLNGTAVYTHNIKQIAALPFVKEVKSMQTSMMLSTVQEVNSEVKAESYYPQVKVFGAQHFERENINGKGVRIAIFDGGFPGVDKNEAFEHVRQDKRIIKTYDFAKKKNNVYHGNAHGTMVMSCIAGIKGGKAMGLATKAEFLLARTEVALEIKSEEVWWLMAAEWADKNGAQIINSSLGYTYHRYFRNEMDGSNSIVGKAAHMATRKGILVVNSAGNEGSNKWKIIGTPADMDSVLSIGGVIPKEHYAIDFSSYGPTADGRRKPNVCGYGTALVCTKDNKYTSASGTSFASPLVAGFAACVMQFNPKATNMEVFKMIEQSASLYPYFDYKHGYGIPNARKILYQTEEYHEFTFQFDEQQDGLYLKLYPRRSDHPTPNMIYFHVDRGNKTLHYYALVKVTSNHQKIFSFEGGKYKPQRGDLIRVHYQGYTKSLNLTMEGKGDE